MLIQLLHHKSWQISAFDLVTLILVDYLRRSAGNWWYVEYFVVFTENISFSFSEFGLLIFGSVCVMLSQKLIYCFFLNGTGFSSKIYKNQLNICEKVCLAKCDHDYYFRNLCNNKWHRSNSSALNQSEYHPRSDLPFLLRDTSQEMSQTL